MQLFPFFLVYSKCNEPFSPSVCSSIPVSWREGMPVYSQCSMYALNYSAPLPVSAAQTVSCTHGWSFDYSKYATTVVTEV